MEDHVSLTFLQVDSARGTAHCQLNHGHGRVFACPEESPGGSSGDSSESMGDAES